MCWKAAIKKALYIYLLAHSAHSKYILSQTTIWKEYNICRQRGYENKRVVFTTTLIAQSGFNPHPSHK